MTIDIRAALERLVELNDIFGGLDWKPWPAAIVAARLALAAEPEPEGPADDDIEALRQAVFTSRLYGSPPNTSCEVDLVRAALARWGTSTLAQVRSSLGDGPQPVPEGPADEELTLTYAYAVAAAMDSKRGPFKNEDAEAAQLAGLRAVLARWGHAPNA